MNEYETENGSAKQNLWMFSFLREADAISGAWVFSKTSTMDSDNIALE
jgi:hypothetical protein